MKMKNPKIKNSIVFVTGANRGIGKALVEELINLGAAKVYAAARNKDSIQPLMDAAPGKIVPVELDVTNVQQIDAAAKQAGDVNILINNAGRADYAAVLAAPDITSARGEMEVNYFGLLNMTRAFVPILKGNNSGGALINISSIGGLVAIPIVGTYSATKAAVHSLTQSIRGELASAGTLVAGVYPGPIDTDMAKEFDMAKETPAQAAKYILNAIEHGDEDIFPDKVAQQVAKDLAADAKAVEKEWGQMVPQLV